MSVNKKRVAIIGAGPGGLAAAKELKECGLEVNVFEASSDIGGQWNPSCPTSAVWPSLAFNASYRLSEFSDFPWEDAVPNLEGFAGLFPTPQETKQYLDAYAEKFDLRRLIRFNSPVESVTLSNDGKWHVNFSDSQADYDYLVVASGIYSAPNEPYKESESALCNFTGNLIHSSKFRNAINDLKGKRVLVIGNSVSGVEIATEAVNNGANYVGHSMRTVRYNITTLAPAEDGAYRPWDEVMLSRLPVWLGRILPESVGAAGFKSVVTTHWSQPQNVDECFKPDEDIMKAGAASSRLPYNKYVDSGELTLKPLPERSDGTKVTFSDGSTEEFDLIISATGYRLALKFLPESVREEIIVNLNGREELALYKQTLVPSHPNLAFVGMFKMIGGAFATVEMQARWTAQVFSGQMGLPPGSRTSRAIELWKQKKMRPGYEYTLTTEINEDIADELGISPGVFEAIRDSKRRLTGPLFPCEYRAFSKLDAEEVKEAARDRLQKYFDEPATAALDKSAMKELHIET